MLHQLSIKNYALIQELDLTWESGFTVITGETGAGKSILLGALGLVLGNRADFKALRNPEKKCVIEASFQLRNEDFKLFFEENDLDLEKQTLIRREITPSGKSRAFINDTPVTLDVLSRLGARLIDIHSQHQTILLNDVGFQLFLIDSFADNQEVKAEYRKSLQVYRGLESDLKNLESKAKTEAGDADYLKFLLEELQTAKLEPGEQEEVERELELLENSGEIQSRLSETVELISNEDQGILLSLNKTVGALQVISQFDPEIESLQQRLDTIRIDLDDIRMELEDKASVSEFDPKRSEQLDDRLTLLLGLQKKHQAESVEELIAKRNELEQRISEMEHIEERIDALKAQLNKALQNLKALSHTLRNTRLEVIPDLTGKIAGTLSRLNMPEARFEIVLEDIPQFLAEGSDKIKFVFSANPGTSMQDLSKVASGGELSRVMLALKATLAETRGLPAIIFDEIDTGVSGETAGKIGDILKEMGQNMQVIAISHLPQIASQGKTHLKVRKEVADGKTETKIEYLNKDQRIDELARLLSGASVTDAARENARTLLQTS